MWDTIFGIYHEYLDIVDGIHVVKNRFVFFKNVELRVMLVLRQVNIAPQIDFILL